MARRPVEAALLVALPFGLRERAPDLPAWKVFVFFLLSNKDVFPIQSKVTTLGSEGCPAR